MFIHTIGKQNVNFAGALAPNFEHSEKLLPIVYYKEYELACKGECIEPKKLSEVTSDSEYG